MFNTSSYISSSPLIQKSFSEIYIPSQLLDYGLYQIELSATMINLTIKCSVLIQIISSGILVRLFPIENSFITFGYDQNLIFHPGEYSIDLDGYPVNATGNRQFF
jgi:hypothetical protein